MKHKLVIGLFLMTIILIGTPVISAKSGYLTSFNQHYNTGGTVLDTCDVCHSGPNGGSLDPYGRAYSYTRSFTGIEGKDSDGDGFTNLEEINALTFPGDSGDHPMIETVAVVNTTETTGTTVNETVTGTTEETMVDNTQEQETTETESEVSAETSSTSEASETTETAASDQQSPGFESITAVSMIILVFYLKKMKY
nr:hypothetical protein [uncultured Methanolobus sp.]